MDENELKKLIKEGESEKIEFKEKFDKDVIETAVAFANAHGGTMFIGISDKGGMLGVSIGKESLTEWTNQISQSTEPRIIPDMEVLEADKKTVVAITIKEFPIKPVSAKGKYFKRVGSSNRILPMQEIAQLHFYSSGMSWDKIPAKDAAIEDIDFEKVKAYIKKANETGRRKIHDESPQTVLEKLELIKEGKPNWAAILLFGKLAQRFLSQSVIHCGRFKDETTVIDDRMIGGTILEQAEEALEFIRKNIQVKFVMTGKPEREQIWEYPLEALREAVVNAICHRDYIIPSNIEIRIYDDKLIIWNPGGLPFGISLNDIFKPHSSVLRNKGIGGILYDIGWIEQWGSGIGKMRNACAKAGLPEPKFEEYQGFRVTFLKDIYTEEYLRGFGLNERQIKAVQYVKERGKITNKEYQAVCGTSERTATRELSDLVHKPILKQIGVTGKGTSYILAAKDAIKTP